MKLPMPDFLKSTFSLIALLASVGFIGLCCWMKDIAALKDFVMLLMGSYGVKKGIELGKNGQAQNPPPAQPPPVPPVTPSA